ncbi:hypothetical protein GLOIN_2v1666809, partial [Rhizophagus irregularis DAOM 181602=DAOM 197198]
MSINLRDLFSKNDKNITLKIINSQKSACKVHLNLCDNLLKVRQYLENHDIIDDTFSFVRNYSENNDSMIEFSEIPVKFEENFRLHQIVRKTEDAHILYITCSKIWKFINDLRKLDYGCTMTSNGIKKASKRAFEAKNCKLEIDSGTCEEGKFKSESSEDLMMDKNLFFDADINVEHFVKLGIGMSIGASKNKESHVETNYSYRFTKYGKASLKLEHLEATPEFIKVVENAIESEDPEEFKQIIEDYGQFIPTEVILGGRVHYDDFAESVKHTAGNSNKIIGKMNIQILKAKIGKASTTSQGRSNSCSYKYTKVIGGKQPENIGNLNRGDWVSSLDNYEYWDCIEFRNPISIFQFLPEDLHERIIKSFGVKIHYLTTENHNCVFEEFRKPIQLSLNLPNKIAKIIKNKDIDSKIFATVTDISKSKNDFFTCQVLCPSDGKLPSLIIHRVQNSFEIFKRRECKLKIGWMIIGYYRDFNFDYNTRLDILHYDYDSNAPDTDNLIEYDSKVPICLGIPVVREYPNNESLVIGYYYRQHENNKIKACTFAYCLKDKCLVKLPNFTFYILKITKYHNHGACDIITLREKEYSNFNTESPKFVSIYSAEQTDCVFLKQRNGQVKIKKIGNDNTAILSVKCAIFDPYT